ncbi:nickel pincer cofactor biosynthesis protein LarC [Syntrophomonas curvata]
MEKVLYFDCFSGISGDMTVGALLDLGVDQAVFGEQLARLQLAGYRLEITKKPKNGIMATDFNVILEDHEGCRSDDHHHPHAPHRNLNDIEAIIGNSGLAAAIKELSLKIFMELAAAEAKVHGKKLSEIHFHEVGAVDSIVDIVSAAICIHMLKADTIYASPLNTGSGLVSCAHGLLPVPAPATLEILRGIPVYSSGVQAELVTPTGAAIIKTLARDFIPLPPLSVENSGYGWGKRELDSPNLLRVIRGRRSENNNGLLLLETAMDDMNPEIYSYLFSMLLEKGALDVYLTSIMMKKNRPGVLLTVLCQGSDAHLLEEIIFRETTTLGVRKTAVDREELERTVININSSLGMVRIKVAGKGGRVLKYAPEYEDCRRIAGEQGLALKDVYNILLNDAAGIMRLKDGPLVNP